MSITIKDVAKEAGVSIATVSKVINHKPSISEETCKRVLHVMKELNYLPNAQASNFARKCSENIIFLSVAGVHTAFHDPHMFEILCGAQTVIYRKKYNCSFLCAGDKEGAFLQTQEVIGRRTADGILVHGSATSRPLIDLLEKTGFPHVVIGRPPFSNTACWIDINNHVSGNMATKYLNTCGYTRIAFIGGPKSDEISRHRLQGFVSSMHILGMTVADSSIKYGSYSKQSGFQMMEELLSQSIPPDAVICEDSQIAIGAVAAIKNKGLSVPDDIGLVTFDDYPLSRLTDPPLTVVDIDVHQMGQQAASLLFKKIKNPALQLQSFATLPELIIRSSTRKGT